LRIARPLRAYAWMEIAIGLYALAIESAFRAIDYVDAALWQKTHPGAFGFALVRFLLAATVLLIPTAFMGATLPMIVAAIRRYGATAPRTISRFYGLNLLGAIVGTLAGGFVLLPSFGVRATIWIAAFTNLLIGAVVLIFAPRGSVPSGVSAERANNVPA